MRLTQVLHWRMRGLSMKEVFKLDTFFTNNPQTHLIDVFVRMDCPVEAAHVFAYLVENILQRRILHLHELVKYLPKRQYLTFEGRDYLGIFVIVIKRQAQLAQPLQ